MFPGSSYQPSAFSYQLNQLFFQYFAESWLLIAESVHQEMYIS